MELRSYLNIISKWLWLILVAVIIAAGASYYASLKATPLYASRATLMVGRVIENPDPSSIDFNTGQRLAFTYAQLVRREPVLKGVIENLGLNVQWQALANQVRAEVIPQTQLLEIRVVDSDPYRAKVLADAIAHQLILQSPAESAVTDEEQLAFTQQQLSELKDKIESGQEEIDRLNQQMDAANSSRLIQDLSGQITVMETKINNWRGTYSQLLLSQQGSKVNVLQVIEAANLPNRPFSPDVNRNVMLASAIGLVLAIGGVFLIEYTDDTINTSDDVSRLVGLPTLGAISKIPGKTNSDKIIAMWQPLSPIVESYRLLRTNIQYASLDKPLRTLMVTSPGPREGKTVTAANLAVVMAQSGLRVILVDADLRNPSLHDLFNLSNDYGLINAVANPNYLLSTLLQPTETDNLWLLTSGSLRTYTPELLGGVRMRELIEQLKAESDLVVFDTPPALLVSDASILGTLMDAGILVIDTKKTSSKEVRRAVENLHRVRLNIMGVVMNRLKAVSPGYYPSRNVKNTTRRSGGDGPSRPSSGEPSSLPLESSSTGSTD
jgi:non-specific protein-tyrosine kinase